MEPNQVGLYAIVAGFLVKELFYTFKNSNKEHTKAIQENTLAITKLEVQLEHMTQKLSELPSIKKDVDAAHEAIRFLRNGITIDKSKN